MIIAVITIIIPFFFAVWTHSNASPVSAVSGCTVSQRSTSFVCPQCGRLELHSSAYFFLLFLSFYVWVEKQSELSNQETELLLLQPRFKRGWDAIYNVRKQNESVADELCLLFTVLCISVFMGIRVLLLCNGGGAVSLVHLLCQKMTACQKTTCYWFLHSK